MNGGKYLSGILFVCILQRELSGRYVEMIRIARVEQWREVLSGTSAEKAERKVTGSNQLIDFRPLKLSLIVIKD